MFSEMRKSYFSPKKTSNKNDRIFSLAWNIVYWLLESHSFEFFGGGKYGLFEPKSWWKYDIYWLLKGSCFQLFGNGKCGLFFETKVGENMILLITKMLLFWIFQGWKIRYFFEVKSWWKDDTYWLLKSSCFELFGDGKYGLF